MKKKLFKIFKILLILFSFPLILNFYIYFFYNDINTFTDIDTKNNYALVFGASVFKNGELSLMLKDRVDTAFYLYENKIVDKILVSGSKRPFYNEVESVKDYLIKKGVFKDDLLLDSEGVDTFQSLKRAYYNFDIKNIVLVSQRFHLLRANYIASNFDFDNLYLISADKHLYNNIYYNYFREFFANIKAFFESFYFYVTLTPYSFFRVFRRPILKLFL